MAKKKKLFDFSNDTPDTEVVEAQIEQFKDSETEPKGIFSEVLKVTEKQNVSSDHSVPGKYKKFQNK